MIIGRSVARLRRGLLVASVALLAGCAADDPGQGGGPINSVIVVEGLSGPTQLFVDGDTWLVAQLAGGENDRSGQVLAIDPSDPTSPSVLIDRLDKPTGVVRFDGDLWVMTADRLLRFDLDHGDIPAVPLGPDDAVTATGPLPNNGRSEGTLSLIDGRLYFDTSGALDGNEVVAGSGRLWSIGATGTEIEVASGFKHAYAHVALPDGSIVVTEIGDGSFDGRPAADAVTRVVAGADHGWPECVPDEGTVLRRAVAEFDGSTDRCTSSPPLLATFPPGATPTSIALVPWDADLVAIALWNRSEVVSVSLTTGAVSPLITTPRPQHLAVDGQRLLVVDHEDGVIRALSD